MSLPASNVVQAQGLQLSRLLWPAAVLALIWVASSRPTVADPDLTRFDDKVAHFAVYGLVGTLVCRVGPGKRVAMGALIAISAYGALDEWHQSFVPGRYSEVGDWVADTLGAAVGIGLYVGWPRYRAWLETPIGRSRRTV